jgi:hypothetical protein
MIRSNLRRRAAVVVLFALAIGGAISVRADGKRVRYFDDPSYGHPNAFRTFGEKWPSGDLTYGFMNQTGDLTAAQLASTIRSAFEEWSKVTNLSFTEVPDCGAPVDDPACNTPDIRILFASGAHGDPFPFDGPSKVLAHATSPGDGAGGDTHFDDDETWTTQDLFVVALHEFGHALGLDHTEESNCPGPNGRLALMCPIYADQTGLEPDDVAGIQSLYGVKTPTGGAVGMTVTGKGLVTSSPAGISCPPQCSAVFTDGTNVTLRAEVGGRRWIFKGWGGACAASARSETCTFTADGAQSVSARFKKRRR